MRIGLTYNLKTDVEVADQTKNQVEDVFEEFDTPETIEALCDVIVNLGHQVKKLGFGRLAIKQLLEQPVDLVLNLAEGYSGRSREAQMPALLEMLNIPYSGPDPLTAALTLDKVIAKKLAVLCGTLTPAYYLCIPGQNFNVEVVNFPAILKLCYEGSSKGIRAASRVDDVRQLEGQIHWLRQNYPLQPILIEEFIRGREFTVGVIGNDLPQILGVMEIRSRTNQGKDFIYCLDNKRNYRETIEYVCPPQVSNSCLDSIKRIVLKLYRVFGCRDIARFDFRLDQQGNLYFLEVNPLPGLNPVSGDIVIMASHLGIGYSELVKRIIDCAVERGGVKSEKV